MKTEKPKEPTVSELLENLATAAAYINQLQRLAWLLVKELGGEATIKEGSIHPLWRLDKRRTDDGTLILNASSTEPPSEEKLNLLADRLRGTELTIESVQKEVGLEEWPPNYLQFQIIHLVTPFDGKWTDSALVKENRKQAGQN